MRALSTKVLLPVFLIAINTLAASTLLADRSTLSAKEELGKQLFFDIRISGPPWSCSLCHIPEKWFGDTSISSRAHRNSLPLFNLSEGINRKFFWDGRADTLEAQALEVIFNTEEFNNTPANLKYFITKGCKKYRDKFVEIFGGNVLDGDAVVYALAEAIAAFERTIVSVNSAYDKYVATGEYTEEFREDLQKKGMDLFSTKGCATCHSGQNFSDDQFYNLDVPPVVAGFVDKGRGKYSQNPSDHGAFKTPTLRNLKYTKPYMHNGHFFELVDVIKHHEKGSNPNNNPKIKPITLKADERKQLVAFLYSLSESPQDMSYPVLPVCD